MNLINWFELKKIIEEKKYYLFKRSDFNINRYKIHKFLLSKKNIELKNYITNNYLINKKYNLVKNDFPYNLEKNILHSVLWINKDENINIKEVLIQEINNKFKKKNEFLYF